MGQATDIEKLNQFNLLKKEDEFGKQSQNLGSENWRLVHIIDLLKNPDDVHEFIITLLSLNVSVEEIYQIICGQQRRL